MQGQILTASRTKARRKGPWRKSLVNPNPPHFATATLTVDLRRRRARHIVDSLVERAVYLPVEDREIALAVYRDGRSAAAVAALRGQGEGARRIRRRLRRITSRVFSSLFAFVIRERDRWPDERRAVATECVLNGLTAKAAAVRLEMSVHAARREMDTIRALHEGDEP